MRINSATFHPTRSGPAGHLLALFFFITGMSIAFASTMQADYLQTQRLTTALGKVLLSHKSTQALLALCAQNFPHLSGSVDEAQQHLAQVNKPFVNKAHAIQQHLVHSIAEQQNKFDAEKFSLEVDMAVQNAVTQFRQTLANYPRQEQHYVCNRLVLSVRAGEWDIRVREPGAGQMILDFE